MTCLTRLAKGSFAASLVFGLSACGNDAETQVGRNADGMPQGDT
ncbi:carbamoyl-phosphate synthase small subunit, partial [Gimesia maris DSM 8797]